MSDSKVPKAPAGSRASGCRMWSDVLGRYDLEEHELALLREMCRTVDLLDDLDAQVRRDGLMMPGPGGVLRVHPAAVEARQQKIALARMEAALRLPAGEEGDEQQGARRPQRRSGARGVYSIRGTAS